jgi:hypothetical protein
MNKRKLLQMFQDTGCCNVVTAITCHSEALQIGARSESLIKKVDTMRRIYIKLHLNFLLLLSLTIRHD